MKDDIKRRFPNLTSHQEEMKKRAIRAEQEIYEAMRQKAAAASSPLSNPAGSVSGFGITVANSIVKNARVVVGWINGVTYTNSNEETITISSQDADLLISETDSNGVALFSRTSPEWIIEDYTGFFEGSEDGPIKIYAPIYSYGGEQDTGYDPIPLYSNFSMRNVNPITTLFNSVFPNRGLQELNPEGLLNTTSYLAEWIGRDSEFSDSEIEQITTGKVEPELYSNIMDPVRKAKDLFQGLEIEDTPLEVEIAGDTPKSTIVEITRSSYYAAEISGIYKFNTYVADRIKGANSTTRDQYLSNPSSKGYITKERASQLLGYTIEDDEPVTVIIQKLYDKNSSRIVFEAIKTDYSDVLTKDNNGGGNSQGSIIYINNADASSGTALIYGSDSIVEKEGKKICSVEVITADGVKKQFDSVGLTTVSEDAASKKYVYSLNLYSAVGLARGQADTQFKIQAETTNNRTQTTNSIIIKSDKSGNLGFYDLVLGTLIPELPGKGDPGPILSGLMLVSDPGGKLSATSNLSLRDEEIGKTKSYTSEISGTTYYVYWNGERWVIDNDTDAKSVIATGESNIDTPVSLNYTDREGNVLFSILSSKVRPR